MIVFFSNDYWQIELLSLVITIVVIYLVIKFKI